MQNSFKKPLLSIFLIIGFLSLNAQIKQTEVLVLGTLHLEQTKNIHPDHTERLLDSLTIRKFDVIAIEQMPAEIILDIKSRTGPQWKELYSNFYKNISAGERFQNLYNINFENAQMLIDSLETKKNLTEEERVILLKASLCAYDSWTSSLQYQLINDKNAIDTAAAAYLKNYTESKNEINLIAVNLAKKLNINKLYPIDNLQDETILLHDFPEFINDYQASQDQITELLNNPFYSKVDSIQSKGIGEGDLYDIYKFLNSAEYMREDKKGQWDIWFKTNFKSKTDRARYSLWEMRNLQIAANIMRLVAANPEKRILVIIGSSHKSFLESYLKQMSDVKLLEF